MVILPFRKYFEQFYAGNELAESVANLSFRGRRQPIGTGSKDMQFAFTDEQNLIRETVFAAIGEAGERNRLYKVMEADGFDREAWTLLTKELMLGGAAYPEAYGGSGLGFVELGSVQEALGRFLVPTPFLTSVIMSGMGILLCGTEDQKQTWSAEYYFRRQDRGVCP